MLLFALDLGLSVIGYAVFTACFLAFAKLSTEIYSGKISAEHMVISKSMKSKVFPTVLLLTAGTGYVLSKQVI